MPTPEQVMCYEGIVQAVVEHVSNLTIQAENDYKRGNITEQRRRDDIVAARLNAVAEIKRAANTYLGCPFT